MAWYKGGAAMEEDLDALLRFLVKVSLLLCCCVIAAVLLCSRCFCQ